MITKSSNIIMHKGLVRKLGDTYEILGSPNYPYDDWAVAKPFSIYIPEFKDIIEESVSNTTAKKWNDNFASVRVAQENNFNDFEHYGMQIVLGIESAIVFRKDDVVAGTTYLKRVGWSLNYYNRDINISSATHSFLYGDVVDVVIKDNRYQGKLKIKDGYHYLPYRIEEKKASGGKEFIPLDFKGYSFDFETDKEGKMLSEVTLNAY